MKTFSHIEAAIVARLRGFFPPETKVTVAEWPETEAEFNRQVNDTRVYVQCLKGDYGDHKDLGVVYQDVMLHANVVILASKLRGNNYLYAVEAVIRRALLGFKPRDVDTNDILGQKMFLKTGDLIPGKELHINTWYYRMLFMCVSQVIEQPDPTPELPTLIEIIVNQEFADTISVTDDEIDGGEPVTVYDDEYDGGTP